MYQDPTHHGLAPHGWLQHHVPWLALFAFVLALLRDEDDSGPPEDSDTFFG